MRYAEASVQALFQPLSESTTNGRVRADGYCQGFRLPFVLLCECVDPSDDRPIFDDIVNRCGKPICSPGYNAVLVKSVQSLGVSAVNRYIGDVADGPDVRRDQLEFGHDGRAALMWLYRRDESAYSNSSVGMPLISDGRSSSPDQFILAAISRR